jgi:hypothetical protein
MSIDGAVRRRGRRRFSRSSAPPSSRHGRGQRRRQRPGSRSTDPVPAARRAGSADGPSTPRSAPPGGRRRGRAPSCAPVRAGCGRAANRAELRARRCRQSTARCPSVSRQAAIGIGGRDTRHALGIADHQVIAALGFERYSVAECRSERLRIRPGADDRSIGRQIAGVGLDRGKPVVFQTKSVGPRMHELAAQAQELREQAFNEPEWVRGVPVLAHQQPADIIARQGGFELTQFVSIEFSISTPFSRRNSQARPSLFKLSSER